MIIVISPAKNLDFKSPAPVQEYTQPDYLKQSTLLIKRLRELDPTDLTKLFSVNPQIAHLNYDRFAQWQLPFTPENAKQAAFAFNGEVYNGLKAKTLTSEVLHFAQNHLRILSGLYGVLRPLDLMQPYRLEMGTKLDTDHAENLYEFWGETITDEISKTLAQSEQPPVLINLASQEYFKSIYRKRLNARVIDFEFLEMRNGKFKPITVYMKKARGMMTRFIIGKRIIDPEQLKNFDTEGYAFAADLSEENRWVFVR